ncbi:tripartite motif-containing protein 2-like [Ptychodera flava]|uniref:tripartite motif-containing protein 2-like n=1 Tax=Ptychodera flava TaxID=63121 RepID=UPI00396A71F4
MENSLKQGASKSKNKTQRDTSVEYQTIGPKGLIRKFGGIGSGIGQLKGPWGVTMSKSGDLIVGDTGNKRLQRSTMTGEFRKTIEFPDFQRSFKPEFSAVSADGNIFTTDAGNKQVVVCDEDGKLVKCFGKGELRHPRGIAVSPINGNVYVVDTDADSVFIYRPDGDHIKTFGRQENADARLSSPWCVAIDYNGNVFVSNCGNHTIKVYSANGDYLFSFGSLGSDNGQFYHPEGIATDMYGYVYVCDCWNNRVQKFDLYGSFVCRVDSPAHHLRSPVGICVNNDEAGDDPFGQVIVVEQNSGLVKVFHQKIEQVEYI